MFEQQEVAHGQQELGHSWKFKPAANIGKASNKGDPKRDGEQRNEKMSNL